MDYSRVGEYYYEHLRNEKLYASFLKNDYNGIIKYLSRGADPLMNDNEMYRFAAANDDDYLLNILLSFNKDVVLTDKGIVSAANMYNSVKCMGILLDIISLKDKPESVFCRYCERECKYQHGKEFICPKCEQEKIDKFVNDYGHFTDIEKIQIIKRLKLFT